MALGGGKITKPSKVVKPRAKSRKDGTPSSRQHHFEGFSSRVQKLKIDPIRRTRRADELVGDDASHFHTALLEWVDSNLSEDFTVFAKRVLPLSESLPMVLHNEERLINLLVEYIDKGNVLSLEPLLSLLSHLAHDLDVRFEKYFQRAVAAVVQQAATNPEIEAIEWSFNSLAYLFKYLQRLLTPDLRPLYNIMADILGRKRQKPFVIRFAAEAMSFLVRKAGSMYDKNQEPLKIIVEHIVKDYTEASNTPSEDLYGQGIMTLFTESIKGVQRTLHSSGNAVLSCLMTRCFDSESSEAERQSAGKILIGSLISCLHHTDAETFKPILDAVLDFINLRDGRVPLDEVLLANRLLFTIAATRKGSRISDWSTFVTRFLKLFELAELHDPEPDSTTEMELLNSLAVIMQSASLDAILPNVRILEEITEDRWRKHFLAFCNVFASLGQDRFESLGIQRLLETFIVKNWKENEAELCCLLPTLAQENLFAKSALKCDVPWQKKMVGNFTKIASTQEEDEELLHLCNGYLNVLECSKNDASLSQAIREQLVKTLWKAINTNTADLSDWKAFALGRAFGYLETSTKTLINDDLFQGLCVRAPEFKGLLPFWRSLLSTLQSTIPGLSFTGPHMDILFDTAISCLSAPSHELRKLGLQILQTSYTSGDALVPELLSVALSIENETLSVQSARVISSHVRRLAMGYNITQSDPYMARAIPTYLFGLLHLRLTQAWEDAAQALHDISQYEKAEEVIINIVTMWLQDAGVDALNISDEQKANQHIPHVASDFECSNLAMISRTCESAAALLEDPEAELRNRFARDHERVSFSSAANRQQALRVLNKLPQLAEKRSRLLTPVLLDWAGEVDETPVSGEESQRWGRKDQKSMLEVFAKAQNPRVLYRSPEVYQALLNLLGNGDGEIQKSALNAILAWKTPEVNRYQEHLLNLLDDARFREEISIFLSLDSEDAIRIGDLPVLMPVLLRLLYGRAVTRAGSASGKRGQQTRRKAIFVALAKFPENVLGQFIDIALGLSASIKPIENGALAPEAVKAFNLPQRKQFGLLNMIEDMLETTGGNELQPVGHKLADVVLLCLLKASRASAPTEGEEAVEDTSPTALDRTIRQTGHRCLVQLFSSCGGVTWEPYARVIMQEFVGPRLDKLPAETAQSVSNILRLLSTWSSSANCVRFLVDFYPDTLSKIAECLTIPHAKTDVKLFVVEKIFGKLLDLGEEKDGVSTDGATGAEVVREILAPSASPVVLALGYVLRQNPSKELLDASVLCVSRLAPIAAKLGPEDIAKVVDVATFLLKAPPKVVHFSTKRDLLQTMVHLIPAIGRNLSEGEATFDAICPLFAFFKDRESRVLLCQVLDALATVTGFSKEVTRLCEDLNSWKANRLDEPDFDRRAAAFSTINDTKYRVLDHKQWLPLLYNFLFFIRDNDELAIRASASFSLRRFIEAAGEEGTFRTGFEEVTSSALLPGLRNGMREESELVRSEFLAVLGHLITFFSSWAPVSDMVGLLAGGDEEASFFTNVLHIQQHRRLRALRRLAAEAQTGRIAPTNTSQIFIPMLEHFVFNQAADESSHNLAAETVTTLGSLALCLDWQQYRSTLRRFIGYIKSKPDLEKTVLRLIGAVVDGLDRSARADVDTFMADGDADADADGKFTVGRLSATLPPKERLASEIGNFLRPLTDYLHLKDESTVSLRVPVAITVVKLLRILPGEDLSVRLPSVLMDVCHILRSRDQGSRDMTRKTLSEITKLLGPAYFGYTVKELRSALQRGYQLHVLSYTVHSILVENAGILSPGDLDYCLPDIASIIMDDIFGATGQEKDAEEYISKMKEVKASKSYDSMELLAKITTLNHLTELVRPIQTLLAEKIDLKTVKKIDELLRRLGLGTTQNEAIKDREVLVFCYQVLQEVHNAAASSDKKPTEDDYKTRRFLIVMRGKKGLIGNTSSYTFKLTRFALDLLRSVLQRHDELKTPANLTGFLGIIGDSLVGGQEEVQTSAVRLLTSIIKVPVPQLEKNATVYAKEAVNIIRTVPSTTSEAAQAALKLLSAILRERPNTKIKETDLAYVLKRVKPDLEEPDRQGVVFNCLRAVISRKILMTEVYDVMDTVAAIMVTNQTRTARDLARGLYFQFLMDYPQGKDRFSKQIAFIVKNLEYRYEEGRKSVLELLHLLLSKVQGDLVQDLTSMVFVPLVMVLVNDDSPECREMAGTLIAKIFERADDERMKNFLALMRSWLEHDEQVLLRRIALQCWTMYLATGNIQVKDISFLHKQLAQLLQDEADAEHWELRYYALQAFAKLSETAPDATLATRSKPLWTNVFSNLVFPHTWVKSSAARLVGTLFSDMASTNAQGIEGLAALPLRGSKDLELSDTELRELCSSSLRILKFTGVTEQLATQTARNLIFLGRCFGANGMLWKTPTTDADADHEDDAIYSAADEPDEEVAADNTISSADPKTALAYLFERLSAILRRDFSSLRAPALIPKTAALQTLAALSNHLDVDSLTPCLQTMLLPLHHLTDPSVPAPSSTDPAFVEGYKKLVDMTHEVVGLLQKKLGTSEYVAVMGRVQEEVRSRREGRRQKRRIEAVAQPEKWAKEKRRKYEGKKNRRKEKGIEARGRRRGW